VVGADGAQSAVRAAAGRGVKVTDYQQSAVVCNFACTTPHLNTAWQWFTDEGVVALLPLPGEHVSLVGLHRPRWRCSWPRSTRPNCTASYRTHGRRAGELTTAGVSQTFRCDSSSSTA